MLEDNHPKVDHCEENQVDVGNLAENAGILLGMIRTLSSELHPNMSSVRSAGLDSRLDRDFGLDSLGRMELMSRIEKKLGVVLSERVFAEAEPPRDLLFAISGFAGEKRSAQFLERIKMDLEESWESPHGAASLLDVLNWHDHVHADRPHIRFYSDEGEGGVIIYGQLRGKALLIAAGLQASGVLPGDRASLMPASDED